MLSCHYLDIQSYVQHLDITALFVLSLWWIPLVTSPLVHPGNGRSISPTINPCSNAPSITWSPKISAWPAVIPSIPISTIVTLVIICSPLHTDALLLTSEWKRPKQVLNMLIYLCYMGVIRVLWVQIQILTVSNSVIFYHRLHLFKRILTFFHLIKEWILNQLQLLEISVALKWD